MHALVSFFGIFFETKRLEPGGGRNGPDFKAESSKLEIVAQIETAHIGMGDDVGRRALRQHAPRMNYIGAVDQAKGLAHIVIGDENADAALFQMMDENLDIGDRNRVDARERLVEKDEGGAARQRAGDFAAAPLAARKRDRGRFAQGLMSNSSSSASSSSSRLSRQAG